MSARSSPMAATAAAPTVTSISRSSSPPTTLTRSPGCPARATATGGLFVTAVARSPGSRWRATWSVVVPPSSRIRSPSRTRAAAARAMAAFWGASRPRRAEWPPGCGRGASPCTRRGGRPPRARRGRGARCRRTRRGRRRGRPPGPSRGRAAQRGSLGAALGAQGARGRGDVEAIAAAFCQIPQKAAKATGSGRRG